MPRSKKPAPTTTEPEEIGPADVAPIVLTKKAKPPKLDPTLDIAANFLRLHAAKLVRVRDLVTNAYGGDCDAQRELAFLRQMKADGRFEISGASNENYVALIGAPVQLNDPGAAADGTSTVVVDLPKDEQQEPKAAPDETAAVFGVDPAVAGADQTVEVPTKSLGEMMKESLEHAKLPYPVSAGTPVILVTEGSADSPAKIKAIHDHGASFTYDLLMPDGGTIDGVPARRIKADPEIERFYGDQALHLQLLEKHQEKGRELAQRHAKAIEVENRLAKELASHREDIKEMALAMANHLRADPYQLELEDLMGGKPGKQQTIRMTPPAAPPAAAEAPPAPKVVDDVPELQRRIAAGDVISDQHLVDQRLDELIAAALPANASTGKPPKLVPLAYEGQRLVLVDVQDGVAVLLPVLSAMEWANLEDEFGPKRATPGEQQTAQQAKGGKHCGMPVKVGRSTVYLAPEKDALLLRVPPALQIFGAEPAMAAAGAACGKDAAAGPDSN